MKKHEFILFYLTRFHRISCMTQRMNMLMNVNTKVYHSVIYDVHDQSQQYTCVLLNSKC